MFILEELAKDVDMNQCSIYFQKDAGGKLCMTAPWDFDFGFGTYGDAVDVNNLICSRDNGNGNYWFRCLLKTDWFRTEVINRMNSLVSDGTFRTVISNVQKMGSFLTSAADKNNQQWNVYGNHYHSYVSWQVSANLRSYAEHINYLVNFASQRWDIILRCVRNY